MAHHTSSNPDEFILPDLGEGVAEAELIKWRVSPGQTVKEHDILADMETDKALVEVPSPRAGTIRELHGSEGQIIKVGSVLVSFGAAATAPAKPAAKPAAPAVEPKAQAPTPAPATAPVDAKGEACDMGSQIGSKVPTSMNTPMPTPSTPAASADAGTVVGSVGGSLAGITSEGGKALATPAVRRLARDLNVDIDRLIGTGMGGRVTEKDVRAAASGSTSKPVVSHAPAIAPAPVKPAAIVAPVLPSAPAISTHVERVVASTPAAPALAPAPAPAATGEGITRIPFRGVRRTIAERLRESVNKAVHFTVMDEADVTQLELTRKKLMSASGEKLSYLPFVAAAITRCLLHEFSQFNATTDDAAGEIVRYSSVNLGIATDTDNGLMVPVIRGAERLPILEIGRQIVKVAEAARTRTATREMLSGSTFTISNVGSHAGRFATPIINYPECGILAVGRAREGVVVRNGMLGVGRLLPLSLACDHRVVDGASAALMLARVIELLQNPEELLAPAKQG
jgi:pyruvate dehydrogenase E2 component (dihydrolipoamide acetyltransferase)